MRVYADNDGALRSIQSDGTDAPIGGGGTYTPPTDFEAISGSNVSIDNGDLQKLTWDTSNGPQTLLDRASPDNPFVLVAGIYAVTVWVETDSALTAGGSATAELRFDTGPAVLLTRCEQILSPSTTERFPDGTLSMTRYLEAEATIDVRVRNEDGTNAISFNIVQATVQRIT